MSDKTQELILAITERLETSMHREFDGVNARLTAVEKTLHQQGTDLQQTRTAVNTHLQACAPSKSSSKMPELPSGPLGLFMTGMVFAALSFIGIVKVAWEYGSTLLAFAKRMQQ